MQRIFLSLLFLIAVAGCSDDARPITEAQQLRTQFGEGQNRISESALARLTNFEDQSSEVVLVQFIEVTDSEKFAQYETAIADVWTTWFSSETFGHLIGDRTFTSIRAVKFANSLMFLDAISAPEFTEAMGLLFSATDDSAWVLGRAMDLPFDPSGSYVDPDLQNLTREDAENLLADAFDTEPDFGAPDQSVFIDMIVSDKPDPFWMANLIHYRETAIYADDPDTTLTGREASDQYAQVLLPLFFEYSSFPELVLDVDIVLTNDDVAWDQAVLHRYASRDAFLRIFPLNPEADAAISHKAAGVENTIVMATEK
jgi:hypothetical protein